MSRQPESSARPIPDTIKYLNKLLPADNFSPPTKYRKRVTNQTEIVKLSTFLQKVTAQFDDATKPVIANTVERYVDMFSNSSFHVDEVLVPFLAVCHHYPHRQTPDYLAFFETLLVEAAAYGFPSLIHPFWKPTRDRIEPVTHRDLFDIRHLLATRIYTADLTMTAVPVKMAVFRHLLNCDQQQNSVAKPVTKKQRQDKVKRMVANLGQYIEARNGTIPQVYKDEYQGKFTRSRIPESDRDLIGSVFIPDMERAKNLVLLGTLLGRKPHTNFRDSHFEIGAMTLDRALKLCPDLVEQHPDLGTSSSRPVKLTARQRTFSREVLSLPSSQRITLSDYQASIGLTVAMPYDSFRDLLAAEFRNDHLTPATSL